MVRLLSCYVCLKDESAKLLVAVIYESSGTIYVVRTTWI